MVRLRVNSLPLSFLSVKWYLTGSQGSEKIQQHESSGASGSPMVKGGWLSRYRGHPNRNQSDNYGGLSEKQGAVFNRLPGVSRSYPRFGFRDSSGGRRCTFLSWPYVFQKIPCAVHRRRNGEVPQILKFPQAHFIPMLFLFAEFKNFLIGGFPGPPGGRRW